MIRDEWRLDSSEPAQCFEYHTLRPWQTRLLVLEPGRSNEVLECRLVEVDFIAMEGVGGEHSLY